MKFTSDIFQMFSVSLFILTNFAGCSTTELDEVAREHPEAVSAESLEGPMYEPSGLQSNPARPQSARPAPPPGP